MTEKSGGKWYLTLLGGILGMILSLIPSALCVLAFGKLYYFCYIFIPVIICLFIRLFRGGRGWRTFLFAALLSLAGVYLTGFFIAANSVVSTYDLPSHEFLRLSYIMLWELPLYGKAVLKEVAGDAFKVIIMLAYLAVGLLFSREFILKPQQPGTPETPSPSPASKK